MTNLARANASNSTERVVSLYVLAWIVECREYNVVAAVVHDFVAIPVLMEEFEELLDDVQRWLNFS